MKNGSLFLSLFSSFFCFFLMGCWTITYQARSEKPVLLGSGIEYEHNVVRHADDKGKQLWLFWGLVPVGEEREQVLTKLPESGDGVKNVTIHESYDVVDWFVQNWSSLIGIPGITNTLNENYQADVVDFRKEVKR